MSNSLEIKSRDFFRLILSWPCSSSAHHKVWLSRLFSDLHRVPKKIIDYIQIWWYWNRMKLERLANKPWVLRVTTVQQPGFSNLKWDTPLSTPWGLIQSWAPHWKVSEGVAYQFRTAQLHVVFLKNRKSVPATLTSNILQWSSKRILWQIGKTTIFNLQFTIVSPSTVSSNASRNLHKLLRIWGL